MHGSEKSLPVVYCDTSFLFEFWEANPAHEDSPLEKLYQKFNRKPHLEFIKSLIKTEKRHKALKPLRRLIDDYSAEIKLVSSFFALTELHEKFAEWAMKSLIVEATGIDRVLSKGRKDTGDMIKKVLEFQDEEKQAIISALIPANLGDELFGVEFKDLISCDFTELDFYRRYMPLSLMQIGTTDILHLIAAKKLNAQYFFSYDQDFDRVKEIVKADFGFEIICSKNIGDFIDKRISKHP